MLSLDQARDRLWLPWGPDEDFEPAMRELVQRGLNIVVNRLAAEQMGFADPQSALGKQVRIAVFPEEIGMLPVTIVGVVENSRFRSVRESIEPSMFFDRGIYRSLAIRYRSSNPDDVRQNVARLWRGLVPDVPFEGEFADDQLAELYATDDARGRSSPPSRCSPS